jgi:hypothetical protein
MALRLATLITPIQSCEAEEVFQECVGIVVEILGPDSDDHPIGVQWLQRCYGHGGNRSITNRIDRLPVDECWEIGQAH